jgi:hypothetical protein
MLIVTLEGNQMKNRRVKKRLESHKVVIDSQEYTVHVDVFNETIKYCSNAFRSEGGFEDIKPSSFYHEAVAIGCKPTTIHGAVNKDEWPASTDFSRILTTCYDRPHQAAKGDLTSFNSSKVIDGFFKNYKNIAHVDNDALDRSKEKPVCTEELNTILKSLNTQQRKQAKEHSGYKELKGEIGFHWSRANGWPLYDFLMAIKHDTLDELLGKTDEVAPVTETSIQSPRTFMIDEDVAEEFNSYCTKFNLSAGKCLSLMMKAFVEKNKDLIELMD